MSGLHDAYRKAEAVFEKHSGILRTGEALRAGIHPRTLYAMRDKGLVIKLSHGLYRLAGLPPLGNPDLVSVAKRVPGGVVCLISALAFHEITTEIPHHVYLATARGTRPPRINRPPVRVFRFSGQAFTEGIETQELDGVQVRIYSPEKTLADCFKYRNKIGMDMVLEALRMYRERKRVNVDALMHFARVCRVARTMRPYLETIL